MHITDIVPDDDYLEERAGADLRRPRHGTRSTA